MTTRMWNILNLKSASEKPMLSILKQTLKIVPLRHIQDGDPMGIRQD